MQKSGKIFQVLFLDKGFDKFTPDEGLEKFYRYQDCKCFREAMKFVRSMAASFGMGGYAQISEIDWEGPGWGHPLTETTEIKKWEIGHAGEKARAV